MSFNLPFSSIEFLITEGQEKRKSTQHFSKATLSQIIFIQLSALDYLLFTISTLGILHFARYISLSDGGDSLLLLFLGIEQLAGLIFENSLISN